MPVTVVANPKGGVAESTLRDVARGRVEGDLPQWDAVLARLDR